MCVSGKIEYKSKSEAWRVKRVMNKKHSVSNIYRCKFCNQFHFGRKKLK